MRNVLTDMLLVLVMLLVVGTSMSPAKTIEPIPGGTLIMVAATENPHLVGGALGLSARVYIANEVLDPLILFDLNRNPAPCLAESWEISSDGMTYTFHLVDTKWHDGEPFTSQDVAFTFTECWMEYHFSAAIIDPLLKSVETPDNHTFVIHLNEPFYPTLRLFRNMLILPKHLYDGTDVLTNPYNWEPVGTGPFKFESYVKGEYIVVVKNQDYYYKPLPYLDRIILKIVPDTTTRLIMLDKREIQFLPSLFVSFPELQRLMEDPTLKVESCLDTAEMGGVPENLIFNLDGSRPVLMNKMVRHALAHAMDKEAIIDGAWMGFGKVLDSCITSDWGSDAFNPDVKKYEHDLDKANELLDEAGYPRGADGTRFSLELLTISGYQEELIKTAEIIKQQWKKIGVTVSIRKVDMATWTQEVFVQRNFDATPFGWGSEPDPTIGVAAKLFDSRNIKAVPWTNAAAYSNPDVDEIVDQLRVEADEAKRKELYYTFQDIVMDDLPYIYICEKHQAMVYDKRLQDATPCIYAQYHVGRTAWWEPALTDLNSRLESLSAELSVVTNVAYVAVGVSVISVIIATVDIAYTRRRKAE